MANKKSRSFRLRLRTANAMVALCILIFLILFNFCNRYVLGRYNDLLQAYNGIQDYYDQMEEASMLIKDYLYTESDESMKQYQKAYESAVESLNQLKSNTYIKDIWRFQLLENMTEEYNQLCEEIAEDFRNDIIDYEENYDTLQRYYYLISSTDGDYYEMITKSMQEQKVILTHMKDLTEALTLFLIGILLSWMVYYTYQVMKSLTKPLELLLHNIQKVKEGKYDLSQISDSGQEMEELCDALNSMAMQIQKNFDHERENANLEKRLLAQENENLRKDELLAQSELRMLQNQINPHFLFNTLNMINRLVEQKETTIASDMILKTSLLLRYALDMENKISDIHSELKAIRAYIDIQNLRLGDRIEFIVHIVQEEVIGRVPIPGMILQPLVENSIKHGLNDVMEDGEVEIYIDIEERRLLISVSDNGEGMEQSEVRSMLENDYQKLDGESHLGLYNVIKRLEMFYKHRIEIHIDSDVQCGFSVMFKIDIDDYL